MRTLEFPTEHRPWPAPSRPWVMAQTWEDLLFAHWKISEDILRPLVPAALELDQYDGECWVSITPFRVSGLRLRGLPAVPGFSAFPELNVRTYVTYQQKPGVYFFSLDAGSLFAVVGARTWFDLPYFIADMKMESKGRGFSYSCHRLEESPIPIQFEATYKPTGPVLPFLANSLDRWLTERYCLYAVDANRTVRRAEIHHAAWELRPAEAYIRLNSMTHPLRFDVGRDPDVLHFADRQDVVVWSPEDA